MIYIEFPPYQPKIKLQENKEYIFDTIRRRWVLLSPEEWVRQNFINFLTVSCHYPPSLIAVEKEIRLGELKKRCDIIVYRQSSPYMIVECKEMNVPLDSRVLQQAQRYNITLQVPILVITNGSHTLAFEHKGGGIQELPAIPAAV